MGLGGGDDGSELRCTWDTQECPEGTAQMQGRDGDVGVGALPFYFAHSLPASVPVRGSYSSRVLTTWAEVQQVSEPSLISWCDMWITVATPQGCLKNSLR